MSGADARPAAGSAGRFPRARGGWLLVAMIAVVLGMSVWFLGHQSGAHPFATRASPPVCAALAAAGTGGFATRAAAADGPLADFDPRATRCAVALGAGATVEAAVLPKVLLPTSGSHAGSGGYVAAWLTGFAGDGSAPSAVTGPWRDGFIDRAGSRAIVIADDNGIVLAVASDHLDADALLPVARDIAEALRAAPPPDH